MSSSFIQGRVTTPVCHWPREGSRAEGAAVLQSGDTQSAGFCGLRDSRKGGADTLPWEPHGSAGSRFLSPSLWPEALCKLSSRQPMRNSNNQCRPQHELRWSERLSCQTWSQRINLGVLRVVCYFQRSGVRGPFLGALGTSSHDNPSVAAASSAGEGDPLTQSPGHGWRLSQHSLGPGSWKGERQTW